MAIAPAMMMAPSDDDDTAADTTSLDTHALYARDALNHTLLSADEERELARRYREDRDPAARDALITHNLKLVYAIAHRNWPAHHLSRLDLVQEGTIGLMRAIERFDERRGVHLSTYATWWIRQAIGRAIVDHDDAIAVPAHVQEVRRRMQRAEGALTVQLGREPSAAEVRIAAGVTSPQTMAALVAAAAQTRGVASLDDLSPMAHRDGGDQTLGDVLADETADGDALATDMAEREAHRGLWQTCRALLTPRQAQVMELRYGLDGNGNGNGSGDRITDGMWASVPMGKLSHFGIQMSAEGAAHTMEEVGHMLGICRERVRQIESAALRTLREGLAQDADEAGTVAVRVRPKRRGATKPKAPPVPVPVRKPCGAGAVGRGTFGVRIAALLDADPSLSTTALAARAGVSRDTAWRHAQTWRDGRAGRERGTGRETAAAMA